MNIFFSRFAILLRHQNEKPKYEKKNNSYPLKTYVLDNQLSLVLYNDPRA